MGGQAPFYTATSTGATFVLNTTLDTFEGADANCKENGGSLAAYTSWSEQVGPAGWLAGWLCTPAGRVSPVGCGQGV